MLSTWFLNNPPHSESLENCRACESPSRNQTVALTPVLTEFISVRVTSFLYQPVFLQRRVTGNKHRRKRRDKVGKVSMSLISLVVLDDCGQCWQYWT